MFVGNSYYSISSIQSIVFSKFKITCTVKADNKTHDQLIDTQKLISSKIIL